MGGDGIRFQIVQLVPQAHKLVTDASEFGFPTDGMVQTQTAHITINQWVSYLPLCQSEYHLDPVAPEKRKRVEKKKGYLDLQGLGLSWDTWLLGVDVDAILLWGSVVYN